MSKSKEHYVNNKDFLHAIVRYKNKVEEAKLTGAKKPPVGEYTCHTNQTSLTTCSRMT